MAADPFIRTEIDPASFAALMKAIKAFDKNLATGLRRNIRNEGKTLVSEIKDAVLSGPGSGKVGIRRGIAAGVGIKVMTGKRKQGIKLTSSARALPAGHYPMHRAYNKDGWRHPVFGTDRWIEQEGRPYFGRTIKGREDDIQKAVLSALEEAVRQMEG